MTLLLCYTSTMTDATPQIDAYLAQLPAWQKQNLEQFRKLVHQVAPLIEEEWKWSVPVFMMNGKIVFAMSAFKAHTKYNFIRNGALLTDPAKLFNNGLDARKSRSIDLDEGDQIDAEHLYELIEQAVQLK